MPFCFYVVSLMVLYYDVTIALNNNVTSPQQFMSRHFGFWLPMYFR